MKLRSALPLALLAAWLSAHEALAASVALLPVRRGVRDAAVTEAVERALTAELGARSELIEAEATRAALRRLRLRAPDSATPETLRALAAEIGAEWLVTAAVHDAAAEPTPDVTLSLRLYDGRDGRLVWARAAGRSGLDERRMLGLGVVENLDELAARTAAELVEPLFGSAGPAPAPSDVPPARGVAAIVPYSAIGRNEGMEVAAAATETLRAVLIGRGFELAQPGCVTSALRGPAGVRWGELDAGARRTIREVCGAEVLVTGAVERWETGGSGTEPEPTVAVALRLLDASTGRILWTGSLEAGGWDRPGWFARGRIHSRGELLRRLLERIVDRMLAARADARTMKESS